MGMRPITRRSVLGGLLSLPAARAVAALPTNPDVVVVGAGIAGITAAREMRARGLEVVVVEARDRIGGRAYTESETFGFPYDHGCAWLHSADRNPLTELITEVAGFETIDEEDREAWLYMDGDEADDDAYEAAADAYETLLYRIDYHDVEDYGDRSVHRVSPPKTRFDRLAHQLKGEFEAGIETTHLSVQDDQSQIGTGVEWMVPQGMAAGIFKALGRIPVELGTRVVKVDWGGKDVLVETTKGTIRAKAVIVTVPTDIIADGTIAFAPALPHWKLSAFHAVPMAVLDKIALQFDPAFEALLSEANTNTALIEDKNGLWLDHLLRPFGTSASVAFIGGQFARDLAAESNADQVAFDLALESLASAFGSDIKQMFVKGHFTKWAEDPYARGAYSAANVGRNDQRRVLRASVDDRVFFAGEATIPKWATQATAAYLSGHLAAEEVADELV